jgi:hypothetical protein
MKELSDALVSGKCLHYWFSTVNLFDGIKPRNLRILAWKIQRILENPAPFLFDDGCCCISPCCCPVDKTGQSTPRIVADCDETVIHITNEQAENQDRQRKQPFVVEFDNFAFSEQDLKY